MIASLPPLPSALSSGGQVERSSRLSANALTPITIGNARMVDLRFVSVAQVVDLIYADMLKTEYVIAPDVLADERVVSFRFDRSKADIRGALSDFLDSLGYVVASRDGVDYVFKRKEEKPSQPDKQIFVYHPSYRAADYLARLVQPVVGGQFTMNRAVPAPVGARASADSAPTSAAAMVDQTADTLVFIGSAKEIAILKTVLPQVDTPTGEVAVRAWVYEVSVESDKTNGFQIATNILGSHLGLSLGTGSVDQTANALRIHTGFLDVAIAALDADSRFHIVTAPNLRIESGKHGRLNVGQSVPVIGSVSYPSTSASPVQSVTYEDAGVIFDVAPTVRGNVIETDVTVEISDFQKTSTGVDSSPTKNTRKSETSLALRDGEVVVMGGLTQGKDSWVSSGVRWLPSFMNGLSTVHSRSDIVLVLQVQKVE